MKAILITFDQAHYNNIVEMLERNNCRGFTAVETVLGRGTKNGEPHYGSHAWPSLASAIITIVEDQRLDLVLKKLKEMDEASPRLGLRAFAWDIIATV